MTNDLANAFESLTTNDDISCILLFAEGKNFSAGPSISELTNYSKAEAQRYWRAGKRLTEAIENARQPVICAISGNCLSVGLSVALACDIRLVGETAHLAFPDVSGLQLVPAWGATQRLTHMIGSQDAKYLLITGEAMTAEQAYERGLTMAPVADTELQNHARNIAEIIARAPLHVLTQIKKSINGGIDVEYGTSMMLEEQAFLESWDIPTRKDLFVETKNRLAKI